MQRIKNDINSGQFHSLYLLFGEERYLKNQFTDMLRNALSAPEDTMNTHRYQGKNLPVAEIIDLAETLPFLADRRVIYIEDSGLFKSGGEQLAEYISEGICESTVFVFTESEVDKRSKLYKALTKDGIAVEFGVQDDATIFRWVGGLIKKENKKITENTLRLFLSKTGTDMQNIRMELEKLLCYCMHKEIIEPRDVEDICAVTMTDSIFDMVEALGRNDKKTALNVYYELIANKEAPIRILFMISRQFHLLLQTKELQKKGFAPQAMAPKLGLQPFIVKKYISQASNFSLPLLRKALKQCVQAEEDIKTGKLDENISVELIILTVGTV